MSRIRPPLTTSMTGPWTTPSSSLIFSMLPQARSYWARFLDRTRRPSLSSFWRTSASIFSPSAHDLGRVDVVADRQLAGRDDALGLVADVEQDFVLVDLHHDAFDDLAVLDVDHRAVDRVGEGHAAEVVFDDLAGGVLTLLVDRAPGGVEAEWRELRRHRRHRRRARTSRRARVSSSCGGFPDRRCVAGATTPADQGTRRPQARRSGEREGRQRPWRSPDASHGLVATNRNSACRSRGVAGVARRARPSTPRRRRGRRPPRAGGARAACSTWSTGRRRRPGRPRS